MIDRARCRKSRSGFIVCFVSFVVMIYDCHSDPASRSENTQVAAAMGFPEGLFRKLRA